MAKEKEPKKELKNLAQKEEEPIKVIKSVFPFDLAPDEIQIYINKVIIVRKFFPFGRKEFPILLKDIKTIRVTHGPIFAGLFFDVSGYETNPKPVLSLKKDEAVRMRSLITGMKIAKEKDLDISKIDEEELIKMAKKIG